MSNTKHESNNLTLRDLLIPTHKAGIDYFVRKQKNKDLTNPIKHKTKDLEQLLSIALIRLRNLKKEQTSRRSLMSIERCT